MSDPNDNSIPILNEVIVPGRARETREASADAAAPAPQGTKPAAPAAAQPAAREPGLRTEPAFAPPAASPAASPAAHPAAHPAEPTLASEPVLAPQPVPTPEQLSSPEPVLAPQPAQTELHQPHVADHTHARKQVRPHHGIHARHGHEELHEGLHEDVAEVSPGVFDRTEPFIPLEAGATVPPDLGREGAHEAAPARLPLDADALAERLHGRFQRFLTGEGRGIIEARCRDAVQQHTSLLVSQITREVAQTLEAEMTDWVREAVEEEIARGSR
ncbi:DUF2486 family protein [Paraburkholderia sp. BR10954]|uniref:DUF2486 family protein n=1 Tax=Paraburkholderia sp. BR10954 TaxID=3236995 RepID=UPI0034D16C5F